MIFKTAKLESKYKNLKRLAILLAVLGVVSLIISYSGSSGDGLRIGNYWDGLLFLALGAVGYFSMSKRLNLVTGSHISFNDDSVDIKSRDTEASNISYSEIGDIIIELKTIQVLTERNSFTIHLEDYLDYKEKAAIKAEFKDLKEKIKTKHNIE